MKTIKFFTSMLPIGILLIIALTSMNCSGSMYSVSANVSSQPVWGPAGYDYVDYYYIPDIDCYYSVSRHQYIYWGGGGWIYATTLPARYSHYNPYYSYKVVITGDRPYLNHEVHRAKYSKYKGVRNQPIIRDHRDSRTHRNRNRRD